MRPNTVGIFRYFFVFGAIFSFVACDGTQDDDDSEHTGTEVPTIYEFESRFQEGESSVAYPGQTLRQVLISDLTTYIGQLDDEIESNAAFDPSKVEDNLLSFYEFDSDVLGVNEILLTAEPPILQEIYDDISSGKDLAGKVAGQDDGGREHKDWSNEFVGWKDDSIAKNGGDIRSPDGLLRAFFAEISENARLQANGDSSRADLAVHQTDSGQDLKQLTQKLLLGAITFAQGTDDYLDEGLDSENEEIEEGKSYTALEHSWDEAFGYFGAARDYLEQSDKNVAEGIQTDSDGDKRLNLLSEYNFGASVNAAKRDQGSSTETDFSGDAMRAFLNGRSLIANGAKPAAIKAEADRAVVAWEKALAATAVHYINDLVVDQQALGSDDYSFDDHAKHFSELKGFALCFQFNPHSPLSDADFSELHDLIGDAPVLIEDEADEYVRSLQTARELLQKAYDFEAKDVKSW